MNPINNNIMNEFMFKTESNIEANSDIPTPKNKINRFKINKPNVHVQFISPNPNQNPDTESTTNKFTGLFQSDDNIIINNIESEQFNHNYISSDSDSDSDSEDLETNGFSNNESRSEKSEQTQEDSIEETEELEESEESEESGESEKSEQTRESEESEESEESNSSDNSDTTDNFESIENLEPLLEKKYFEKNLTKIRYHDEIKLLKSKYTNKIDLMLIENNYTELTNLLEQGETIYQSNNDLIVKLCGNKQHNKKSNKCDKCDKECNKTLLYRSLKNTNRGIKTLYYLLLKLLISQPNFRNLCKCCEDTLSREYLINLEKNFQEKKPNIIEDIKTRLEPKKMIELQINFLINKFMNVIGIFPCECKFKEKLNNFYQDNYLNFKETIKIYTKTIPQVIKILKIYYKIKDNHEELGFIKDTRCIHEDIRFNNLTYCMRKNYTNTNNKIIYEIIMKIDIINTWLLESIKIGIHLYNQQSLEYFRYILANIQKLDKQKNLSEYFNKIYSINNELLDLGYTSNKKNIIISIIEYYDKQIESNIINLVPTIKNQFETRNGKSSERYDTNDIFIYYIIESFRNNLINIGLEFLKNIKNLKYKKELESKIQYIFNTLLSNDNISIKTKISYLKIINKNKINVIEYDIINKLIDIKLGDKIILEFNKDENSLFNIGDYKNPDYIFTIIKRCIINNKVNILDYVLYNLDKNIKNLSIEPLIIYLINIPKKTQTNNLLDREYEYIGLLEIILKYDYNLDIKINEDKNDKDIGLIEYCINNELNQSAKLLIENKIKLEPILLIKCIETTNHIILGYIINKNPNLLKILFSELTLINYLFDFNTNKNLHDDVLMRFILKIINPIIKYKIEELVYLLNFQDENNELFGMKILNSKLENKNKIIIFSLLKDLIDPMKINNYKKGTINTCNFPIIMYSMLLNQVEITYIFLNNLFKNKIIRKLNSSQTNTIFDYYHNNQEIEMNFIPIILKFIQDNYKNNFNENYYLDKKIILESDSNTIEVILFIIGLVLFILQNDFTNTKTKTNTNTNLNAKKLNKSDITLNKSNITNKNKLLKLIKNRIPIENNGYVEITVDSQVNNIIETDSIQNQYKMQTKEKKINKNIWISSSKPNDSINENYSEKSSISESEIFFN
jgi:hypothetical protein